MDYLSIVNNPNNALIEQSGGGFWDIFKWLFIVLIIVLGIALLVFTMMYFFFRNLLTRLCKNQWIYGILVVLPLILEIVGTILTIIGVGVPIAGIGIFLEIFTIICDFLRKDPGWKIDVGLGIFGLIPVIGLVGNVAKIVRRIIKFIKKGKKIA